MPVNGPKEYPIRFQIFWNDDLKRRAQRLAHRYGGSVAEVLRAGIAALEREHKSALHRRADAPVMGVIHILHTGLALCGAGMPLDWPGSDRWVRIQEDGATCAPCVSAKEHARDR